MQFSAFKGPFEERIEAWNHKLFIIGEVLDKWLEVRARRLVSWCGYRGRRGAFTKMASSRESLRTASSDRAAQVQRNWMYLQPIFESPDINKQLPAEGKKFATVNKNWCATVTAAKARPVPTPCFSRKFSELEVRVDGVNATFRHRDAVFMIIRASTRRAREPRQFRDSFARRSSPSARPKW